MPFAMEGIFFNLYCMSSKLKMFRLIAILEGISYLALIFIAVPLKYIYLMPMPNKIMGMTHGVLFIGYVFYLMQVKAERNWDSKKTIIAFIASLLPFGTFVLDAKVLKKEM